MNTFKTLTAIFISTFTILTFVACDDDTGDKTIGGANNQTVHSVAATSDGGCILAGENVTGSGEGGDFFVAKLDSLGNVQWSKNEGGSRRDCAYSVKTTSDGGYVAAGVTESSGPGDPEYYGSYGNMMVVKYSSGGSRQWIKVVGNEQYEGAFEVIQTSDGGYLLGGYTHSFGGGQFYIVKLDASGNTEWDEGYGSEVTTEVGYAVKEADDGGFIIAGNTIIDGKAQALVVKTDSLGGQTWSRTFGDTSLFNFLRDIEVTADGGYIAAGYRGTDIMPNNDCDAWIVKLDGSGNITWEQTYGGSRLEMVYSIKQHGSDYVFAGETRSFGNGNDYEADIWAVKINSSGSQVWSKTYGGGDNDTGKAVDVRSDGGYVVVGDTMTGLVNAYDIMVLKLDSNGNN